MKILNRKTSGRSQRALARVALASTLTLGGLAVAGPAFAGGSAPSAGPRYVSWPLWGNGSLSVTWNAPLTNKGSAITSYEVDAVNGGNTFSCTAPVGTYFCTITGLTNGLAYQITGYALAGANKSPGTSFYYQTPTAGRPYPATAVTVAQSGNSANVTWTNPSNLGSPGFSRLAHAVVYAFAKGQPVSSGVGPNVPSCTSVIDGSSCRFDDGSLTPGVTYNFVVRAFNNNASGALSDPSSDYLAIAVPGQLQGSGPTATASTTGTTPSITVSWPAWGSVGAPSFNASPVTSYSVLIWGNPYSFTPAAAGCDVSTTCSVVFNNSGVGGTNAGIAYGSWYHPVVAAVNSVGMGLYSYQSNQVFPGYAPSTPANPTLEKVSGTPTSLSLTWAFSSPSSGNGGWQIQRYSGYLVKVYDDSNSFVTSTSTASHVRSTVIEGLTPGTTYHYTVQAVAENTTTSGLATSGSLTL